MLTSRRTLPGRIPAFAATVRKAHQLTIGLRREDPARLWERRCPLTPIAIEELIKDDGIRVLVQDCNRRVFSVQEFEKVCRSLLIIHETPSYILQAGAHVQDDLSSAQIIMGIKEIPLIELKSLPPHPKSHRTHLMFSHTGKGQSYNMPLLSEFVSVDEKRTHVKLMDRLIDYEFLTDGPAPVGKRVVAFGWFAGGESF